MIKPNIIAPEAQVSLQQSLHQSSTFDVILSHINPYPANVENMVIS